MARITGLEPDPRHPGMVRVLVEGRLYCTVEGRAAGSARLEAGAEWDAERQEVAGRLADESAAWQALLAALARRAYAVEELRRYLTRKGHLPRPVAVAIARALADGLLDDAKFAGQYAASRAARGRGPARLRHDLRALGVADRDIEAALARQWPEGEDPLELARELAARRARQLASVPLESRRRRVMAYLFRRGFSGAGVSELVRRVVKVEAVP